MSLHRASRQGGFFFSRCLVHAISEAKARHHKNNKPLLRSSPPPPPPGPPLITCARSPRSPCATFGSTPKNARSGDGNRQPKGPLLATWPWPTYAWPNKAASCIRVSVGFDGLFPQDIWASERGSNAEPVTAIALGPIFSRCPTLKRGRKLVPLFVGPWCMHRRRYSSRSASGQITRGSYLVHNITRLRHPWSTARTKIQRQALVLTRRHSDLALERASTWLSKLVRAIMRFRRAAFPLGVTSCLFAPIRSRNWKCLVGPLEPAFWDVVFFCIAPTSIRGRF